MSKSGYSVFPKINFQSFKRQFSMKTTLIATLLFLVLITSGFAQHVPQGMKYQAVARDMKGQVIANQDLQLRISLYADPLKKAIDYVEIHKVITNELGLFSLTVGEGFVSQGIFSTIPWSTGEVWMEVAIQTDDETDFVTISDSRMLSVPYAFHALTASEISGSGTGTRGGGDTTADPPVEWRLSGNKSTDPAIHKLGTTDRVDLVIVTTNLERIRILSSGQVLIRTDLVAEQNVNLNTLGGETNNSGNFTVGGKTLLKDNLGVEGVTYLNDILKVRKGVELNTQEGNTIVNGNLTVENASSTHLTGTLLVDSLACLNGGMKLAGDMSVKTDKVDYIATFENTNGDSGDGIKIKLGKTHPRMEGNTQYSVQVPGFTFLGAAVLSTKEIIKDLMFDPSGTFTAENFAPLGQDIIDALETETNNSIEDWASAACNLTKDLIIEINDELALPWDFPAITVPEIQLSPDVTILGVELDGIEFPATPIIGAFRVFDPIPVPSCPAPPSLSEWELPDFRVTDVPNSLSHENVYVQFVDKNDVQVGAIRAESIEEWCDRYLSLTYCLNVFNSFAGVTVIGLDPSQILETLGKYAINSLAQISNLADAYNSIGVEYSSGFGDYAEWLERADHHELISAGDIVAVKGGKITRDLANAEQIMAISSNPIVLGNIPEAGKDPLGNKVAFMGQIPVKIMGPVASGDYIVANGNIPGYGVAIHPVDMSAELMRLAVGRSWENLTGAGPKLVNTVVGVHNGDYIHIIQRLSQQVEETGSRLTSIENKLEMLFPSTQGHNGLK